MNPVDIFTDPATVPDARMSYGRDAYQFADLRVPRGVGPHPVVIVVHGGFWRARYDLEHIGHLCAALTDEGYATWSLEYRRIGNAGGGWPGTFLDAALGANFLCSLAEQYALDLGRVVALGHSAGGHLALWLAGCGRVPAGSPLHVEEPPPLRGVVALAAVSDLRLAWEMGLSNRVVGDLLGGSPAEVPEPYAAASPVELLPLGVPQVLVHGTEDEDVPYELSGRYASAARAAGDPVELVTLRGTGHMDLVEPHSQAWPDVLGAVRSLLPPDTL
jgi:acetyl esterase/lipase